MLWCKQFLSGFAVNIDIILNTKALILTTSKPGYVENDFLEQLIEFYDLEAKADSCQTVSKYAFTIILTTNPGNWDSYYCCLSRFIVVVLLYNCIASQLKAGIGCWYNCLWFFPRKSLAGLVHHIEYEHCHFKSSSLNLLNQILTIKSGLKACLPVMFKRDDSIVFVY